MKYLKTYEKYCKLDYHRSFNGSKHWENQMKSAALYMEQMLQLNEADEGFCAVLDWNMNYNEFVFHFHQPVKEETLNKLHVFVSENNLEINYKNENVNYIKFEINLDSDQVNKFADLYNSISKYNL